MSVENKAIYTQEQINEIIIAVNKLFGYQINANDGTMLISNEAYNEFIKVFNDKQG